MKKQIFGLVLTLGFLTMQAGCLLTPGPGEEPPNFIQTVGDGGIGDDAGNDSTCTSTTLPNYTSSDAGPTLVSFRNRFIPTTISDLEVLNGASDDLVIIRFQIRDFAGDNPPTSASQLSGCTVRLHFIKDSDNNGTLREAGGIGDDDVPTFESAPFSLQDISFEGGEFLQGLVFAWIQCEDGRTSNILYRYFNP